MQQINSIADEYVVVNSLFKHCSPCRVVFDGNVMVALPGDVSHCVVPLEVSLPLIVCQAWL